MWCFNGTLSIYCKRNNRNGCRHLIDGGTEKWIYTVKFKQIAFSESSEI